MKWIINIKYNRKLNGWNIFLNKKILITFIYLNNEHIIKTSKNISIYLYLLKILRQLGLIKEINKKIY